MIRDIDKDNRGKILDSDRYINQLFRKRVKGVQILKYIVKYILWFMFLYLYYFM